jgi:integrase
MIELAKHQKGVTMASLWTDKQGNKTIQFYDRYRKRKNIRLGGVTKKIAETVRTRVEYLVAANGNGSAPDLETVEWLGRIDDELADKLAKLGLAPARCSMTLGDFAKEYVESRAELRPNTRRNMLTSRRLLLEYGGDRNLREWTPALAMDWKRKLVEAEFAGATISKTVKHAKQFFKVAKSRKLIESNPFDEVKAGGERNDKRLQFIDRATIAKVIDAAPNASWRVLIALARFGGLRTPSETLALKWSDVNWAEKRITIPSVKTEGQGKAYRVIPFFPELVGPLTEAFDAAPEGAEFVVMPSPDTQKANLRTRMRRIMRRAGIEPWPRTFHNLRASRQMELADEYPSHVVTRWLGNSPQIAERHYLKDTETHFDKAVKGAAHVVPNASEKREANSEAIDPKSALQNARRNTTAPRRRDNQETKKAPDFQGLLQVYSTLCNVFQSYLLPPRGVEPLLPD